MELYLHQRKLLEHNPPQHLLCWDTGTGKSIAAIMLANINKTSALIIVPKALVEKWQRDVEKYVDMGIVYMVVSKETFRKEWNNIPRFDAVIVDEAHYFAGMRNMRQISQMSKSLLSYLNKHRVQYRWFLTATPYLSTPLNIYRLAKLLGQEWSYTQFKQEFFEEKWIGNRFVDAPKKGIEKQIAARVRLIGSIVDINEAADVPEQTFETEYFALTSQQKTAKKEIEKVESNFAVRYMKYHQIENGVLKGDEYTPSQSFDCFKNDRLLELVQEKPKVAVICRYTAQIEKLTELFIVKSGKPVFVISGQVEHRDEVIQRIEAADECVVIVQSQCSEGYELPSVGLWVFASLSFSYKDYKQMLGRGLRINKLKKNTYVHLVTRGIDTAVYNSIMNKQDFDVEIYARNN